ncbi:MAG: glycosyltransferase family 39 protein [Bauldia sp.]
MSPGRAVALIIIIGTALRLVVASTTGLGIDESYMASNARILSLSYVDHPPLHVWLAGLAARLAGSEAPIVLRLPFVFLFAGSTWLIFLLTRRLFGPEAGLWAVIAFSIAPVLSLASGSWMLPGGPLVFFLLAAAVAVADIVFAPAPPALPVLRWILAGCLAGLALLSKYSAIFFFAGVFVFLATTPGGRRWLATPGPWIGVLVGALLFVPVVVWNARNGMAGLAFQEGRFDEFSISAGNLLLNIGGQALYLTPWLFLLLAYALVRTILAGPFEPKGWLLGLLAIGPIAVFTILSLSVRSLPHWSLPGWLFAFPLAGREAARLAALRPTLARWLAMAASLIFAVSVTAFVAQAASGAIASARSVKGRPADRTVYLVDWTELKDALSERGLLTTDTVVAADDWTTAGKASYALGAGVPVLCLCKNPHHFAARQDQRSFSGRDVIVVSEAGGKQRRRGADGYFASMTPLAPVEITRAGKVVLGLDLAIGHSLQFPAPP